MSRRRTSLLMAVVFVVAMLIGVNATAQTMSHPTTSTVPQTQPSRGAQNHSVAENNPACERIISECKKLGFIPGQYKKDNGLWKDCFDPVVHGGGSPSRDGKPISVPVSASDIQSCRAAEGHHKTAQ